MFASLALAGLAFAPQVGVSVVVDRPTEGPVVSLLANVTVSAPVHGDVVALLGDVRITATGRVYGDAVAVGGQTSCEGQVSGRSVSLGAQESASWPGSARTRLGLGLLRLGWWLVVGWALLLVFPRAVRECSGQAGRLGGRLLLVGVLALVVWLAAMLIAVVLTSSPLGAGLLILGVGMLLVLKAFGLAGLALALGRPLVRRLPVAWRSEVTALTLAQAGLLAASLTPSVGRVAWQLASVLGIAVAVSAMLGSRRRSKPVLAVSD